ncbi:MAG: hypothetical protein NTZ74_01705 [Chloroflexi bacterium]|nr:hypothetical protein [Chloroflexota bacterium]
MPLMPISGPEERGQAAVEILLVLAILVLVSFGGIELSRGVALRGALDSSSAAAVRVLSLDPARWSFSETLVRDEVGQNVMAGVPAPALSVLDASGTVQNAQWLSSLAFGTPFQLEASASFQAAIPFLAQPSREIRVRHWGIVERYP